MTSDSASPASSVLPAPNVQDLTGASGTGNMGPGQEWALMEETAVPCLLSHLPVILTHRGERDHSREDTLEASGTISDVQSEVACATSRLFHGKAEGGITLLAGEIR